MRQVLHVHGRLRAGAVMERETDFIVWLALTVVAFAVIGTLLAMWIGDM